MAGCAEPCERLCLPGQVSNIPHRARTGTLHQPGRLHLDTRPNLILSSGQGAPGGSRHQGSAVPPCAGTLRGEDPLGGLVGGQRQSPEAGCRGPREAGPACQEMYGAGNKPRAPSLPVLPSAGTEAATCYLLQRCGAAPPRSREVQPLGSGPVLLSRRRRLRDMVSQPAARARAFQELWGADGLAPAQWGCWSLEN